MPTFNGCEALSVVAEAVSRCLVPAPAVLMAAEMQQGAWLIAAAASLLGWHLYRRRSRSESIYGDLDGAYSAPLLCMGLCVAGPQCMHVYSIWQRMHTVVGRGVLCWYSLLASLPTSVRPMNESVCCDVHRFVDCRRCLLFLPPGSRFASCTCPPLPSRLACFQPAMYLYTTSSQCRAHKPCQQRCTPGTRLVHAMPPPNPAASQPAAMLR